MCNRPLDSIHRLRNGRSGATVEEIEFEGEEEEGHRFRRARLLWPPLRCWIVRGGGAAAVAVRKDAFYQIIAMFFFFFCFPVWFPFIIVASLVLIPALVVDELLQVTNRPETNRPQSLGHNPELQRAPRERGRGCERVFAFVSDRDRND